MLHGTVASFSCAIKKRIQCSQVYHSLATVAGIGLTVMMRFGASQCPSVLSKPVRIWNWSHNTKPNRRKNSWYFTHGILQTIATYVFGINSHVLQLCFPRWFISCVRIMWCWENDSVPGHTCTRMAILIHSFLKCCVPLFTSAAWSKHQRGVAVRRLAPEPVSPMSVIQVNSAVEVHSEMPVVILPWAIHAPSDITTQRDFLKRKTLLIFFF